MKVLVVDDSKAIRMVITNFFKDFNVQQVTQAEDGLVALDLLNSAIKSKDPFDLIIADINMPNMSGLELAEKVKSNRKLKATRMVLITAEGRKSDEAFALGVDGYLVKPFEPQALWDLLAKIYRSDGS